MAMAPQYERARLLNYAIGKATRILQAPIDRVEVSSDQILFWARSRILFWARTKKLAIFFQYPPDPSRMPGLPPLLLDGEAPTHSDDAPHAGPMALPRWAEREELLDACISKAATKLQASIDRIEVTKDKVMLGAGPKEITISYRYVRNPKGSLKPRGFLLDGEDYWDVSSRSTAGLK
jgi:hypothetical protein